jgi:hypothetical protein
MRIHLYKRFSFLLATVAGLFVVQSNFFFNKPEVPEELIKKHS